MGYSSKISPKERGKTNYGHPSGKEKYAPLQAPAKIPKQFLKEVLKLAVTTWKKLPIAKGKTTVFAGIRQKADKANEDFMVD